MKFKSLIEVHGTRQAVWTHLFEYHSSGFLLWRNPLTADIAAGDIAGTPVAKYLGVNFAGATEFVHRIIFEMFNGDTELGIDHIDGDKINNCIENLRAATKSENARNTLSHKDSTLGLKGVDLLPTGKYRARIRVHGVTHQLGHFDTPEEALSAYNAASRSLHGEFANAS